MENSVFLGVPILKHITVILFLWLIEETYKCPVVQKLLLQVTCRKMLGSALEMQGCHGQGEISGK